MMDVKPWNKMNEMIKEDYQWNRQLILKGFSVKIAWSVTKQLLIKQMTDRIECESLKPTQYHKDAWPSMKQTTDQDGWFSKKL